MTSQWDFWTLSSIFMFRCPPDTKMAITPSVFELQCPSTAHNVALYIAHLCGLAKFWYIFEIKNYFDMNMAAILWKFKLFDVALIWLQIRNLRPRISGIGLFLSLFIRFLTPIYYLPKFRRNLQVCSFNGLSVCLSVTRYRSQFLTNQHQTWSTYGIWSNTGPYTFYRSKVK